MSLTIKPFHHQGRAGQPLRQNHGHRSESEYLLDERNQVRSDSSLLVGSTMF